MTTRRAAVRRVKENTGNGGVPPQDNQGSPQEKVLLGGQAPVMTDGEITRTFLNLT